MTIRFLKLLPAILAICIFTASTPSVEVNLSFSHKSEALHSKIQAAKAVVSKSSEPRQLNLYFYQETNFTITQNIRFLFQISNYPSKIQFDSFLNQNHHDIRAPTQLHYYYC